MRVDAKNYGNEAALHAIGAISVAEVRNDKGVLIAYDIDGPSVDLAGYAAAVAAQAKAAVPASISDRQFAQALAKEGTITQPEALDFVRSGTLPKALQDVVDAMTDKDEAFDAEMMLSGATTFERAHPMVETLGKALGKSDADLDALWTAAGAL